MTATLIAIAREQEQRRDQNIMDAWQKGGMFEGKRVTDTVILAHWKKRLKDISKDDPLYDTYKNAISQYEYSIAESKMTAQYAMKSNPGAGDDAAMAAFYLNWAKKIPKDSEFYRVLQRDAGQYLRSARAKREAGARQNKEEAYSNQMLSIERKLEGPGQVALQVITMLAQRGVRGQGAVLGEAAQGDPRNSMNATNLGDLQLPSVDQMTMLLNAVSIEGTPARVEDAKEFGDGALRTAAIPIRGNPAVLYHDESGQPITGQAILAMFTKADPNWNGNFNINYVQGLITDQKAGIKARIRLAESTGHISDAMSLKLNLAKVNEYGNQIAAWPVLQAYQDIKEELDVVMKNDGLMPKAKRAAIERLLSAIGSLASDPRIATDDHLRSQLTGEALGTPGTVTVEEDMTGARNGFTTAQDAKNSEVLNISSILESLTSDIELTDDETSGYFMTQGNYVSDGVDGKVFQPAAGGRDIGAATMADISAAPGAGIPVTVMVPNGDGGGMTAMVLVPAPVNATATVNGRAIKQDPPTPVASFIRYKVNGVETTIYGLTDADTKATRWTTDPPWEATAGIKVVQTSNGTIQLDMSRLASNQLAVPVGENFDYGNGFSVRGAQRVGDRGAQAKAGALVMNPAAAAFATQPERQRAGFDPTTDSFSPTLISLKATPDGKELLAKWAQDPKFVDVIERDARHSAGMTWDGVNWNGGNEAVYEKNIANGRYEIAKAKNPGPSSLEKRDSWWRDSTKTDLVGSSGVQRRDPQTGALVSVMPGDLPATVLSADGGNRMGALSGIFAGNSNTFQERFPAEVRGASINAGITLTVPTVTNISPPVSMGGPISSLPIPGGSVGPITMPSSVYKEPPNAPSGGSRVYVPKGTRGAVVS